MTGSLSTPDGSAERTAFEQLQQRLGELFSSPSDLDAATVVVVPSLTLHGDELRKIVGVGHFEERLLFLTRLLRRPHTRMIYVTSRSLDQTVVDYALDMVASLPTCHARPRLDLLECGDETPTPLTSKILHRPQLIADILRRIPDTRRAYLVTFNSTPLERDLALRLGLPLYSCDPALAYLGTKSGSRKLFRDTGVPVPDGFEDIRDEHDLVKALTELRTAHPNLRKAVVKLDDSFAGGGNAVFSYDGAPETGWESWIAAELPARLHFAAQADSWESYGGKLREMGGIVECFIDTPGTTSPSAQLEIGPTGSVRLVSTHDQELGGPSGQVFVGCAFPAHRRYGRTIHEAALRAGEALAARGVTGQLSIDFVADGDDPQRCYALEINLRMGGATAPYFILQGLTEGSYDSSSGDYVTADGMPRYYLASDRVQRDSYRALGPSEVVDIALRHGLHYRDATRSGVAFYMLGALRDVGKLGVVAIDSSPQRARQLYSRTLATLDAESGAAQTAALGSPRRAESFAG